jgi:indole-3-glycerol phosphate synthase
MRCCVGALVASAALFASTGAFMMVPSALPPAAQFSDRPLCVAPQGRSTGRFAPVLRSRRDRVGGAAAVQMGVLDDILARKEKEVEALKANMPEKAAELLGKTTKHKNSFLKAVKKPKGTISVVGQMKVKAPNSGRFAAIPAPDILSAHIYEAGGHAVSVCVDEETYGLTYDDLEAVAKQQLRFKGNFPGPLPILAHDFFIDESQLAVAAAAGAQAVNLNVALYKGDGGKLKDMIEAADKLGMDALVEIHNKEELDSAIAAGSKIIGVCNRNMETFELQTPSDQDTREWVKPYEETVFALVKDIPDGIIKVAMGGVNETLTAWTLRDEGYSSVIVGEAIIRGSEMRMSTSQYQSAYNEAKGLIIAFRSKGSKKYGPTGTGSFYGKGEGAKETLGMISI